MRIAGGGGLLTELGDQLLQVRLPDLGQDVSGGRHSLLHGGPHEGVERRRLLAGGRVYVRHAHHRVAVRRRRQRRTDDRGDLERAERTPGTIEQ